jgi:hypothetical protein
VFALAEPASLSREQNGRGGGGRFTVRGRGTHRSRRSTSPIDPSGRGSHIPQLLVQLLKWPHASYGREAPFRHATGPRARAFGRRADP